MSLDGRESRKIKSIENKSQIKFLKKEVPTGKDICSKQLFKLIEKIEKVKVDDKQIEPYLNDVYKTKLNFSENQIKNYYEKNIEKFNENFRSVDYSMITPSLITGKKEYTNFLNNSD